MSALRLARQSTCVDSTERSEASRSMPKEHEHAPPVGLGGYVLLLDTDNRSRMRLRLQHDPFRS